MYAVGFVTRPIGALLFGHVGDTAGRRSSLLWSIAAMALPTVLIGCLPTYEMIGIWATVLMTVLRAVQGLAMGGEFGTAMVRGAAPMRRLCQACMSGGCAPPLLPGAWPPRALPRPALWAAAKAAALGDAHCRHTHDPGTPARQRLVSSDDAARLALQTYMVEIAREGTEGRMGAFVFATALSGIIFGNAAVMIVQAACSPEQLLVWGWRLPFLFAAVSGGLVSGAGLGRRAAACEQARPASWSNAFLLHVPVDCTHLPPMTVFLAWHALRRRGCRRSCCA